MDQSREIDQLLRQLESFDQAPQQNKNARQRSSNGTVLNSSRFFNSHPNRFSLGLNSATGYRQVQTTSPPLGHSGMALAGPRYAQGTMPRPVNLYGDAAPSMDQPDEFDFDDFEMDDVPLDDFDEGLLAQPVEDRRSQAESGRARLSLAPRLTITEPSRIERPNFRNVPGPQTPIAKPQGSSSSGVRNPSSPSFIHSKRRQARQQRMSIAGPSNTRDSSAPDGEVQAYGASQQLTLAHAPPMIQNIQLLSTTNLPDRFRSIFKFTLLNAIQSKCFDSVYSSDDNLVISAPTGSGKTVIMELAICRLIGALKTEQYKVVYQAPTKSLCSERFRDWQAKFSTLGLQCAELTGDTEQSQLKSVQSANIIITTPEKWDSMTRKWKDHQRLMQLVKLFLIDEVHILRDNRGATLEAVVSRMKSVGSGVRFVALSATIPNAEDVATWLGKDANTPHLPAYLGKFGEEFRPVKLQKFVYGYDFKGNDFAFDKVCQKHLHEVIEKHGNKKPIMIFCMTRPSCVQTAQHLSKLFNETNHSHRLWHSPTAQIRVQDQDLRTTIASGVAFHHAGLDGRDRHAVEKGFLDGQINIICCTSTLAVGVNLPCYLVIIKNTVAWQDNGCKEYADLEVMQMLGRAGRPQFENSAVVVILTKTTRVAHFEKMVSDQELLESCLHLNLVNHLNAEIGLGTVNDLSSAKRWLAGTFLYVRVGRNPDHYKIDEATRGQGTDEWLEHICEKDINLLQDTELIEPGQSGGRLKCTAFGNAMAKYYVKFETMKLLLSLPPKAKMSEILSAIAQADEFREIRLKSGEKGLYKEVNKSPGIKFPMRVDLALPAHKVSLSIQAELGAVDFPAAEQFLKLKQQFQQDKGFIFQHINRLIRCIIDCNIYREDSVAVRHALELARSFAAKVWDSSPLQMKQINQLGVVAVRKLASAGINSLEALEITEASRVDTVMSRNPPFGKNLLANLRDFPKPRVMVKTMGKETKPGKPVKIRFRAEIGFMNENPPTFYNRNPVYICFLAETSDGRLIEFRRMGAKALQNGHEMLLSADLYHPSQYIACHVSCDEIAGTSRSCELKPGLPASLFPAPQQTPTTETPKESSSMNISKRRASSTFRTASQLVRDGHEYGDDDLDDNDLLAAAKEAEFIPIEALENASSPSKLARKAAANSGRSKAYTQSQSEVKEPVQLDNGKWACNHNCKDKTACKHFCCREGLDKPPKIAKKPAAPAKSDEKDRKPKEKDVMRGKKAAETGQTTLSLGSRLPGTKIKRSSSVERLDMTGHRDKKNQAHRTNSDQKKLDRLHDKTSSSAASFTPINRSAPSHYAEGKKQRLSFLSDSDSEPAADTKKPSSDYGGEWFDDIDLPSTAALLGGAQIRSSRPLANRGNSSQYYDEDVADLEAGMVGLEDLLNLTTNDNLDIPINDQEAEPLGMSSPQHATTASIDATQPKRAKGSAPVNSSSTLAGDKMSSSSSRLFVTLGSAGASLASRVRPEVTPVKRNQHHLDENEDVGVRTKKKLKRDLSRDETRPLSSRENAPAVAREEESGDAVETKKEEKWWEGDDIDQDFIREFAPYVNFV